MNEVELVLVQPDIFCVVDNKFEVWWDPWSVRQKSIACAYQDTHKVGWPGLRSMPITWDSGCWSAAGSKQCSGLRFIAIITKVNGPYACARADVEHMSGVLYGREVKLVVVGQAKDMMLQIKTVGFSLRDVRTMALSVTIIAGYLTSSLGKMYLPSL